jgi:uncharacterized membrane protein YdjX (TVP38/TMEM64 family)
MVLVYGSGLWRCLSLEEIRAQRTALKGFVQLHPIESLALYVLIYCAVVALSMPGALIMTLSGGVLFGPLEGGAAAVAGVSSGAVLMFMAAKSAFGDVIRRFAPPNGVAQKIEAGIRQHAFSYILFLRLMPAAPIWIVNLAAGFVRTPLWIYLAATVIGVIPSTFIYAAIGASVDRSFAAGGTPNLGRLFHAGVFIPLFGLALLSLAPILYQRLRARA